MATVVTWIAESVLETLQVSGMTLQTFLVFCTVFLLAYILLKRPRNLPPYPAGRVPVLGHLLALGRAPHLKLTAWRRQYGDVLTVRMGMEDVVVLNGYATVKDALASEKFASRPPNFMQDSCFGFGEDMGTAPWGTKLKQSRRFASATLKTLGMKVGPGSIEESIREEAGYVRNRIVEYDGQPFDVTNDVYVVAANIVCCMTFGKRYEYDDKTFLGLAKAIDHVFAEIGAGQTISAFPLLRFVPGINRAYKEMLRQDARIDKVLWDEIARHRENLDRENPRDYLDFCLLELEQKGKVEGLTEENVMYMAKNFFFAGVQTTAVVLRWSLLHMTLNPDIQKKVQEELDGVVGKNLPTLAHRSQLPYVNACLQEVMRVRTLVPFSIPHATTQEVKVHGYDIPKGTQVLPNLYSLHMDPAYWPDPDLFEPERFLDAEGNVINNPDSFMPFSAGRRVCVGEQLARMEIFLFFSALLQSFTFKTPEGAPPPNSDGVLGIELKPHPFQLCAILR
ncbi:cytochrome P450 2J4-like [Branchiostoma lanceolatum]|uniref:cytochrome P450 2J4-like n=1 Tax=Branchiostoma lanceolatum TaxID=7740 RepID=UPI003456AA47